jgi:CBS domain-containing protein
MGALRTILEEKDQTIHAVGPETSVLEAVGKMCQSRVGALLVEQLGTPIGILSERDIMTRLVLEQRDPAMTTVGEIMTPEVLCIDPDRSPEEAMSLMTARRVRHLPVVEGRSVVGIISIGDLVRWASRNQDYEIRTLREYVSGVYAG